PCRVTVQVEEGEGTVCGEAQARRVRILRQEYGVTRIRHAVVRYDDIVDAVGEWQRARSVDQPAHHRVRARDGGVCLRRCRTVAAAGVVGELEVEREQARSLSRREAQP